MADQETRTFGNMSPKSIKKVIAVEFAVLKDELKTKDANFKKSLEMAYDCVKKINAHKDTLKAYSKQPPLTKEDEELISEINEDLEKNYEQLGQISRDKEVHLHLKQTMNLVNLTCKAFGEGSLQKTTDEIDDLLETMNKETEACLGSKSS